MIIGAAQQLHTTLFTVGWRLGNLGIEYAEYKKDPLSR